MRPIFVFLGPVGSGKSTQISLLTQNLKHRGFKVSSTQLKAFHILSNILIIFLMLSLHEKTERNSYRILRKKRSSIGIRLFSVLTFLDIPSFMLRYLATIAMPRKLGYILLVEEYIPGTVADYLFWWNKIERKHELSAAFLNFTQRLFYKNEQMTTIFYLDGAICKLMERITLRNTYTEELDYIEMQRSLLLYIARYFNSAERFHYIDTTSMDVLAVERKILAIVDNELGL